MYHGLTADLRSCCNMNKLPVLQTDIWSAIIVKYHKQKAYYIVSLDSAIQSIKNSKCCWSCTEKLSDVETLLQLNCAALCIAVDNNRWCV